MVKNKVSDLSPTMVKEMISQIYDEHRAGCCLHIITDDGNIRDPDVKFCVEYAKKQGHQLCYEVACAISKMSELERAHLLEMGWCPKCRDYSFHKYCGLDDCVTMTESLPLLKSES